MESWGSIPCLFTHKKTQGNAATSILLWLKSHEQLRGHRQKGYSMLSERRWVWERTREKFRGLWQIETPNFWAQHRPNRFYTSKICFFISCKRFMCMTNCLQHSQTVEGHIFCWAGCGLQEHIPWQRSQCRPKCLNHSFTICSKLSNLKNQM